MKKLLETQLKRQIDKSKEEEKKKLQTQSHDVRKMEPIDTLAGAIAHKLNNLLMGIRGRVSLMSDEIDPSDASYDHLKKIEDYVDSAAEITKQLLDFELRGESQVKSVEENRRNITKESDQSC